MFRIAFILLFLAANCAQADETKNIALWEQNVPNALGSEEKDKPKITLWLPDAPNGTAVIVCPGGGYSGLAMDHEGKQIAQWLNSFGTTAAVLDYRHRGKGYGHPNPMLDVQRAIRLVRKNAAAWKLDPAKIGVLGFSAGGHLASTAATHFENHSNPADEIDTLSCRPDFAVLCYPVIVAKAPYTHQGSFKNLLGENPSEDLTEFYSNDKHVSDQTPPVFLFSSYEDQGVPPENCIDFYLQLRKHHVKAELHIYQIGRHGLGLAKGTAGMETWPNLCETWLRNNKLVP